MGELPVSTKIDTCRGHDACKPRAFQTFSPDVTAEGIAVVRETDTLKPHGCDKHDPHTAKITKGHPTVTADGLPIGHVTARVDCPSNEVKTGRSTVVVGQPRGPQLGSPVGREGTPRAGVSNKPFECRGKQRFQQQLNSTCALASTRSIIAQMTGQDVSEQALVNEAKNLELRHPSAPNKSYGPVYRGYDGTVAEGLPGLLGAHGVDAHMVATPATIDASYINDVTNNGTTPALFSVLYPVAGQEAGHAILVDGVDEQGNVLIRDPWQGGAAGCQKKPLSEFTKYTRPNRSTLKLGKPPAGYNGFTTQPKAQAGSAP